MTRDEAIAYLEELENNDKLHDSFYSKEYDYNKAIEFIEKYGHLNQDEFNEYKTIIRFGKWRVESDFIMFDKPFYYIPKESLWDVRNIQGVDVFNWPLHIIGKDFGMENAKDFNLAFAFCLDYFRLSKPSNKGYISLSQTLYVQKQMLDAKNEYNEAGQNEDRDKLKSVSFSEIISKPEMEEYSNKMANIKVLKQ